MMSGPRGPGYDVDPSWYCGADDPPCRQRAGWGTDHLGTGRCKLHGGCTRTHVTAGRVAKARQAVVTYGLPREVEPVQALLEEVHRTAGHVAYLGAVVAELEQTELKQLDVSGRFEKAAVWVEMYQAERKHLAAVAKAAIDAGIAERQVQLAEAQGSLLADVIRRILADLELSAEQAERVPVVVPRHLRALTAGGAA